MFGLGFQSLCDGRKLHALSKTYHVLPWLLGKYSWGWERSVVSSWRSLTEVSCSGRKAFQATRRQELPSPPPACFISFFPPGHPVGACQAVRVHRIACPPLPPEDSTKTTWDKRSRSQSQAASAALAINIQKKTTR